MAEMIAEFKRKRKVQRALTFPTIEARVVHTDTQLASKEVLAFEIVISYRFEVNGEGFYGSAFSVWVPSQNQANVLVGQMPPERLLTVRYNPKDAFENHALASDNAGVLPFALAE